MTLGELLIASALFGILVSIGIVVWRHFGTLVAVVLVIFVWIVLPRLIYATVVRLRARK